MSGQGRRAALVLALLVPLLMLTAGCGMDADSVATGARQAADSAQSSDSDPFAAGDFTDDSFDSIDDFDSFDDPTTDSSDSDDPGTDTEQSTGPSEDQVDTDENRANRDDLLVAADQLEAAGSAKVTTKGHASPGEVQVDISADGAIDFRTGNTTLKQTMAGEEFEVRVVDGVTYMKYPDAKPGDKPWIKMTAGEGSNMSVQKPTSMVKRQTRDKVITKKPGQVVDGVTATVYEAVDPEAPETVDRFYVDGTGRLYRVDEATHQSIGGKELESSVNTTFSEFGAPVRVEAPPPDQVEDFDDVLDSAGSDSYDS